MKEFTLVSTVFNEAKRLEQTIGDLEAQTIHPNEIIITDAGSTDGTYEMLLDWQKRSTIPILLFQKLKCNVAEGRNIAIRHSNYELIVSTDFGCRFKPRWLESLVKKFAEEDVKVVGGAYSVDEAEQKTIASKAAYILSKGYNIDVNSKNFIPSSRSIAYTKEVFERVGGYCEWLTLAADDLVFGKEMLVKGYKFSLVEDANVMWLRHTTTRAFKKEAFRYGLGDGESSMNLKKTSQLITQLLLRCFSFLIFLLFIYLNVIMGNRNYNIMIVLVILPLMTGFRPYASIVKLWLNFKSPKYDIKVFLFAFYLFESLKINYIKGYLRGYFYSTEYQKQQRSLLKSRLKTI